MNVCRFYELEKDFLEKYEYELDWGEISQNQNIEWSLELLEKFESRLVWHELGWNPKITWSKELIKRFNKRIDWYYLSRNINLPISKEFIDEHRKDLFIIENNNFLTEELKIHYAKNLLPASEYKEKGNEITEITDIESDLKNKRRYFRNPQKILFDKYIKPHLESVGIDSLFQNKFPYQQRYFKLSPIYKDIDGLTPEFKIEGENPFGKYIKGYPLHQMSQTFTLVKGSLQEGKDRLYEMPRLSNMSYNPSLFVSENVKQILEQFKSTRMQFHPTIIKHDKLKTNLPFYLLEMEHDSIYQLLDLSRCNFFYQYSLDSFGILSEPMKVEKKIDSLEELPKAIPIENAARIEIYAKPYLLKDDYDIFTIKSSIIVNEFVKKQLEDKLPNQISFESAELHKIIINQNDYDNKRLLKFDIAIQNLSIASSPEMAYYELKMQRLKNTKATVFPTSNYNDELAEFENKNGIHFPENFRELYSNGLNSNEFTLLKTTDFYIEDQYEERYPETHRSVIIAENGCGDCLGLILKKESDYELDDTLIEFLHETGEIKRKS